MTLGQILILALIQGLTEFLPISSSAHLILVNQWLGWADEGVVFDVAVHLGSLLAVIGYFRRDLMAMFGLGNATGFDDVPPRRLLLLLVIATVPLGLAGLLLAPQIAEYARSTVVIAWASIVFGLLLWAADAWGRRQAGRAPLAVNQAVFIGLAQALALIPGASRAGVTIAAGLALGLDRRRAARFSFLMAIPAIAAAGLYSLARMIESPPLAWGEFAVAMAASCLGAWLCIGAFLRLVERIGFLPFVIYRVLLGVLLLTF